MQSRQGTPNRNRATGFSDADWGALEKRLSDTRDILRDILFHLRRVLDNLKSASSRYQSAGRAWRKDDSPAGGFRQQGHRQNGPAAGAYKSQGTTGSRFQSASSRSTSSSSFSGPSSSSTKQAPFGKAKSAGQSAAGGTFKSASDREAGSGFSWSWRTKTGASSPGSASSSASAGASARQKASPGAERAGAGAGSAGTTGQDRAQQAGARSERQEHRHRTTGPGGGSSYQDYKQRTYKSVPGPGRMTLTQACALLCVTYPCTAEEVRIAYRKQARRHHPDLGGDEEMMKSINQAYELALSWCSPLRAKAATWAA